MQLYCVINEYIIFLDVYVCIYSVSSMNNFDNFYNQSAVVINTFLEKNHNIVVIIIYLLFFDFSKDKCIPAGYQTDFGIVIFCKLVNI